MVPYERIQYGLSFLLKPANFTSFFVTVFGLFTIATATLVMVWSLVKKQKTKLNLTGLGTVTLAFGTYFIFNILYYYITGGYSANPSVWYEVIGPLHNPNLWGISLIFIGLPLILQGLMQRSHT